MRFPAQRILSRPNDCGMISCGPAPCKRRRDRISRVAPGMYVAEGFPMVRSRISSERRALFLLVLVSSLQFATAIMVSAGVVPAASPACRMQSIRRAARSLSCRFQRFPLVCGSKDDCVTPSGSAERTMRYSTSNLAQRQREVGSAIVMMSDRRSPWAGSPADWATLILRTIARGGGNFEAQG